MFVHKSDQSDDRECDEFKKQDETNSLGRDMRGGSIAAEFRHKKRARQKQRNRYANDHNPTHRMKTSDDIDLPNVGLYRAGRGQQCPRHSASGVN